METMMMMTMMMNEAPPPPPPPPPLPRLLPPGFRFHPTDEELITYYLVKKVFDNNFTGGRAIAEVDLNKCEPWELPEKAKMGEKEWYFYSLRDRKYPTGLRTNRATEAGYWKATGKDREIYNNSSHNSLVGMKKTLVFYRGRAPRGLKTNWVMHEYRLEGNFAYHYLSRPSKDEWVISRVFQKSGAGVGTGAGAVPVTGKKKKLKRLMIPPCPTSASTSTSDIIISSSSSPSSAASASESTNINNNNNITNKSSKEHVSCFSTNNIINAPFHYYFPPQQQHPSMMNQNNIQINNINIPIRPMMMMETFQMPFLLPNNAGTDIINAGYDAPAAEAAAGYYQINEEQEQEEGGAGRIGSEAADKFDYMSSWTF